MIKNMTKKLIIFDFDGTIANDKKVFLKIEKELHNKYDYPNITIEEIRKSNTRALVLKKFKLHILGLPLFYWRFKKSFEKHFNEIAFYPKIREIIHKLKTEGNILGIVSSNYSRNALYHIKQFLLRNKCYDFSFIIHSGLFLNKKRQLKFIIKNYLNAENEIESRRDIIFISDYPKDISVANDLGIRSVAVTWGFSSKENLEKSHPDFLFEHVSDLKDLSKL